MEHAQHRSLVSFIWNIADDVLCDVISFTRYFYKPQSMRTLEEIRADIESMERETDGLLPQIMEMAQE